MLHDVRVRGLHPALPWKRLLGAGDWSVDPSNEERGQFSARLEAAQAADLAARLRGLVLLGRELRVDVTPPLPRNVVRAARLEDARRRRRRSDGFSRPGAVWDEEGRYSLTPEALALKMANKNGSRPVVDAGCGVGGNAIAFARRGARVLAIEQNLERAEMARKNCQVYAVQDRVEVKLGDALKLIPRNFAGMVFADPPWGRDWKSTGTNLGEVPLVENLWARRQEFEALWLKLPPAYDPARLSTEPGECPISVEPYFGVAAGDRERIKFIVVRYERKQRVRSTNG